MSAATAAPMTLGGQVLVPGSKQAIRLPITQDLDGGEVAVWAHAIRGSRPGKTLVLVGGQHGDEWQNTALLRQAVEALDPAEMSGSVLVIPACNPVALGTGHRLGQPESDGPDLNRVWPGTYTWLAESIAKVVDREVLRLADAVLDFHLGPWGSAFGAVVYGTDYPSPEVNEVSRALAFALGYPMVERSKVVEVFPGPRSLMGYAGSQLGAASVAIEVGGLGFSTMQERAWLDDGLRCIRNALRHLGILDEPLERPERVLHFSRTRRVNPSVGGLLVPERDPDELLREVHKGEVLARVISPYTFEELEQLESPCDGWLMYLARRYPVRPGHWAFGVADAEGAEWITQ